MPRVTSGAEVLLAQPAANLAGKRLGLVANPSSVTRSLHSVPTLLHQHSTLNLVALYGPEHGVRGEAQAGDHVDSAVDPATGLPMFSLYGETEKPTAEMLAPIDAMLVDMQDIGARFTTYISTVANLIDACAEHGTDVVILDRPNPLPGNTVAGNVLDPTYRSFVGCHTIPVVHGLTIGEFARLYARDSGLPEPEVIRLQDWSRDLWYDQCDLPWVLPSPNLPTLDSTTVFPATCFIEGTNLSEGRCTTRPFEFIGAPYVDADTLTDALRELALPGFAFRPVWFQPSFSKHAGTVCGGVQVYVTDRDNGDAVALGVHILATLNRLYPDDFAWRPPQNNRYFIDLLSGTDRLRTTIDAGTPVCALLDDWRGEAERFRHDRSDILLY
jgi:uncharacterized protein YbbC (DUF1343 family)